MCLAVYARTPVDERAVPSGLAIFEELGFLRVRETGEDRQIEMVESPGHVELDRSIRYLEGLHARMELPPPLSAASSSPCIGPCRPCGAASAAAPRSRRAIWT